MKAAKFIVRLYFVHISKCMLIILWYLLSHVFYGKLRFITIFYDKVMYVVCKIYATKFIPTKILIE